MTREEAIKKIKTWGFLDNDEKEVLETLIPELKESEDEKVMHAIDGALQNKTAIEYLNALGVTFQDAHNWLEKQKPIEHFELKAGHWYICHRPFCCRADHLTVKEGEKFMCEKDGVAKGFIIEDPEKYFKESNPPAPMEEDMTWLEKQGEQKVSYTTLVETGNGGINAFVTKELPTNSCDDTNYCSDCINKKGCINCEDGNMKETLAQKPADKVEPEFHEGDWIIYKNDICKIVKREEGCNKLVTIFGIEKELVNERNLSTARLWSIADAKDGHVLACNEEILLFKSYSVQGRISLYCWYNGQTNNFHSKGVGDTLVTTRNKIYPATKEQRDLLFQKMKEAGYEWDAYKKELKKIKKQGEQASSQTNERAWLHLVADVLTWENGIGQYLDDPRVQQLAKKLCSEYVKKLYNSPILSNSSKTVKEWTEEDEELCQDALDAFEALANDLNPLEDWERLYNWLRTFKQRIGG